MELTELCTQEDPAYKSRIKLIRQAQSEVLEACLALPDCRSWFLEAAFKFRKDTNLERTKRIMGHINCPLELIALVDAIYPEMVADVPAMREVQLAMLEPGGGQRWNWLQSLTRKASLESLVEHYLYKGYIRFIRTTADGVELNSSQTRGELLCLTPGFVIEHFLQYPENEGYVAAYMGFDQLEHYVERLKPKNAARALKREGAPQEWFERFALHKSVVVRKAVAADIRTPQTILRKLALDKHAGVKATALDKLPEDVRSSMLGESLTDTQQASKAGPGDAGFLTVLRLAGADDSQLATVASKADDLLACAASLHPQAGEAVLQALRQRADLPLWARIGLAMKTQLPEEIDGLIAEGDYHLWIGLSDNPHLSLDQAMALMQKLPEERVLANLVNTYIDQPEAIDALSKLAVDKSPLATALKSLLKDTTSEKKLSSIHGSRKCRARVMHRLVARHQNCPEKLYRRYACYLSEDLAQNPAYSLAVLESAKPIKPEAFDEWKYDDYLDRGHAPEFLCDWVLRNGERSCQRKVIACSEVNPNSVRHLAVLDDSHVHRRFVHYRTIRFSEYEYRMLARIGSASLRKKLVEEGYVYNGMLQELAQDKDKSVAKEAQKLARKRGVPLAAIKPDSKPRKKGLGNKAARLELAEISQDFEILSLLAKDKLKDVRREVARRKDLPPDLILQLLDDPEEQVLYSALSQLCRRNFSEADQSRLQQRLLALVADIHKGEQLRRRAMENLPDPTAGDAWYGRENGRFDSAIFTITADSGIIDNLLFRLERGEKVCGWSSVFNNPNLSLEQCDALLLSFKRSGTPERELARLIRQHPNLDLVVALIKKYRKLLDEYHFWEREQECSPEQVLALSTDSDIPLGTLISVWSDQLWKLPEPEYRQLFERALQQGLGRRMSFDSNMPPVRQAFILKRLLEVNDDDLLQSYFYRVKLTEREVDNFLETGGEPIRHGIAEGQDLSDTQIRRIENDESNIVRTGLYYSCRTSRSRLSSDFLRGFVRIDRTARSGVIEELRLRGEEL
ncbi:hypothetical protein [Microbulbifer sp. JTAC008]|uniref:hypothetical protein n=1 Tax=unclassified Microbulbifer TaxID=2619833 RepID=UPI00403907D3